MAARKGAKGRKIEVNGETADLLAARAAALGMSVAEFIAAIAGNGPAATPPAVNGDAQAAASDAPSAQTTPPDARWREVKAWIDSWGKSNELPRPKLGK